MRVLTRSDVFRAFPELDRFSDERCRALVTLVYRSNLYNNLVGAGIMAGIIVGLAFSAAAGVLLVYLGLGQVMVVAVEERQLTWLTLLPRGAFAILLAAPPLLLAFVGRDFAMGFALRRAARGHLSRTVCPQCRYQLLGQRVDAKGRLRCPECGRRTTLLELGLERSEDLLPPPTGDAVS